MKRIIIERLDMIKCPMNKEYVFLANCCYCSLNRIGKENDNYIYCKYKV